MGLDGTEDQNWMMCGDNASQEQPSNNVLERTPFAISRRLMSTNSVTDKKATHCVSSCTRTHTHTQS